MRSLFIGVLCALLIPLGTAHAERFTLTTHEGVSKDDVQSILQSLDANYSRVLTALGVEEMPTVHVQIWRDEETYQAAMFETFGSRAPGSRGYVVGPTELRLLLTSRPTREREAVHEFVHNVSLIANPSIGNNPRWLWETAALHIAGEFFDPAQNDALRAAGCPSLEVLNSPFDSGGTIYSVGFLLGAFIETEWGPGALSELVRSNGDTQASLGLSEEEFERRWCRYLQTQYGFE